MARELLEIEFADLSASQVLCVLEQLKQVGSGPAQVRIEERTLDLLDVSEVEAEPIARSSQAFVAFHRIFFGTIEVKTAHIYTFVQDENSGVVEINFELDDVLKHQWGILTSALHAFVIQISKQCNIKRYAVGRDPANDLGGRLFDEVSYGPATLDDEGFHVPESP